MARDGSFWFHYAFQKHYPKFKPEMEIRVCFPRFDLLRVK
jgi:hypothetical protein